MIHYRNVRTLALLLPLLCAASLTAVAAGQVLRGKAAGANPEARVEAFRDDSFPSSRVMGIRLSPPRATVDKQATSSQKRLRIGSARVIEGETETRYGSATLDWMPAPGGGQVA